MAIQQPRQKNFFAKYWWLFVGGGVLLLAVVVTAIVLSYLFIIRGVATVTDLRLSESKIVYGDKLKAIITLENKRLLSANYTGILLVDGKEEELKETEVDPKETVKVEVDLSRLKPGTHMISIGGQEKEFKVLKPAEFTVAELTLDQTDNILVGSTLTATAKVTNSGEVAGTYLAKFTYDGAEADTEKVEVQPGAVESVTFSFTVPANGAHEIALEGLKQSYAAYNPANIAPVDLKLSAALAKPGEKVNLTVLLANTGDLAGKFPLEVLVNGESAYTEEITVEGGKQAEVPLSITEDKAGRYTIKVGDLEQTLTVAVITRPASGTVMVKTANSGRCTLTVQNNFTDRDAVIILASTSDPKKQLLSIYVRAGEKTKKIKVKDGTYVIYQMTGSNYDSATKKFLTDASFSKYDDTLPAKTTSSSYQIRWTDFSLTLNTQNGNATTTPVDESNFPE